MKPIITRLKLDVTPLPEYKNSWTWKDVPKTKLNVNKTDRQAVGDTPDLSFLYSNNELECVEIGLTDNGTPKMMRNFCWKLVKDYELDPEEIKVAGFIISGMHMTNTIMTFKHGSIGLLYKSRRIKMPTTIKEHLDNLQYYEEDIESFNYQIIQILRTVISNMKTFEEDEQDLSEKTYVHVKH